MLIPLIPPDSASYHVVYDATTSANSPWKIGAAFVVCAIALIAWRRSLRVKSGALAIWFVRAGILVAAGIGVVVATYQPASKRQVIEAMRNHQFQTVVGVITDYSAIDSVKHLPGHFTVQTGDASHFTFMLRPGLPTVPDYVPLKRGECVRLAVVGGMIGKFEIANTCSPS